ncbi:MAG: cation:proton antiporter [Cyanobacteria bacterium P01_A01_bin.17]
MEVHDLSNLVFLGLFLVFGGHAYEIARYLQLPRVTLLVLTGLLVGPSGLNIIPLAVINMFPTIAYIALSMVAFRLGEAFIDLDLKEKGLAVFGISLGKTVAAASLVFAGVFLIQKDVVVGLLLAALAPASAPAATLDVISETKAKGPLTQTIVSVLAVDNILSITLFALVLIFTDSLMDQGQSWQEMLLGGWEIFGAVILGFSLGWPTTKLAEVIDKEEEPSLLKILGVILLCAGLAYQFQVSYLLACIVLGITVAKSDHPPMRQVFSTVETIGEPFLVFFFLLAGCELQLSALSTLGLVGIIYMVARCAGFVMGGTFVSHWVKAEPVIQKHIGWCLFPQAGVALGLAVIALEHFPQIGPLLLSVIVSTTVVFELFGPTVTRWHLFKAKEVLEVPEIAQ